MSCRLSDDVFDPGVSAARFEDEAGDEFWVEDDLGSIRIGWEDRKGLDCFEVGRDDARVLSRLFRAFAETGRLSADDIREAIGDAGENPPPRDGAVTAIQDRIDELEGRIEAIEERLQPTTAAEQTPEQRAAEMGLRLPVGAKVSYRLKDGEAMWDDGVIDSAFLFVSDDDYVVRIEDKHGNTWLAEHVEPRS